MAKKANKTPKKVEEIQTTPEVTNETTPEVVEESIPEKQLDEEIKKVEEKMVIGKVRNKVYQKTSFIKMKSLRSYPCNYELPDNIRKYLNNKGWGANVVEKDEEWLIKHNAKTEIIEELKKFLSEHYF